MLLALFSLAVGASPLFKNLQTGSHATLDDYRGQGRWLVVMIWASDCEVCKQEAPLYQQFHQTPELSFYEEATANRMARQLKARSKSTGDKKKMGQGSVQQIYEMSFCLWALTYELNKSQMIRAEFAKDGVPVQALVELVGVDHGDVEVLNAPGIKESPFKKEQIFGK